MGQKITKGDTSKYILKVAVCGDPNVIKIYMDKRTDLSANQDGYKLLIDPVRGNGSNGIIKDMDVDLYLCVYNVRDLNTLKLLRQNILPDVQSMGKKMAIAGLGVEYRVESDPMHSSVHLIQNLGEQYNCPVSEIITSDPTQMAVGTYALYSATLPERLRNQLLSNVKTSAVEINNYKKREVKKTKIEKTEKTKIRKRI